MAGWTENLITGLAQYLAAAGVGVWQPNGVYTAGQTAIVYRAVPQTPDRLITLAPYPIADAYQGLADTTVGVQARIRGTTDPRVCDGIADALYELLDSATNLRLGGVAVVQIYRQSAVPLGQDGNGRWEASHNYYVDAMRPTANNAN